MVGFKFVHTADLHLDSPFRGVGSTDLALQKRLFQSTYTAFHNIIDLCIKESVDFLLIAGDLYDEADLSFKAQLICLKEFNRLKSAGIQVYLAHGNHDHCGGWRADLDWPENVHFFPAGKVGRFAFTKDGDEVAGIFGLSYPVRAVRENYVPEFVHARRLEADSSPYLIGVLHTNAGGFPGYDNYAPCTVNELALSGFDYWALGHVHTHQLLHPAKPVIAYPGTPQGRSYLESGPKGCYLVEVTNAGETVCQWVETDDVRWLNLEVSIENVERAGDLLRVLEQHIDTLIDELAMRSGILNITLTGRGSLARELRRQGFLPDLVEQLRAERDGSTPFLWIASIKNATRPDLPMEALREEESLLGDFLKLTLRGQNLENNPELREILLKETVPLYKDRMLRKILTEADDALLQRLVRISEEMGIELFGLEVD